MGQFRGDFADEARGLGEIVATVQAALFGMTQVQALLGAGDADIGQTPLFLQAQRFRHRAVAGEQALFQPNQEHQRKLQTLGHVQGHQLHAVLAAARLALARFQRSMGEKGIEVIRCICDIRCIHLAAKQHRIGAGGETGAGIGQFFQVFEPRPVPVIPALLVQGQQATAGDHMRDPLRQGLATAVAIEPVDQVEETAHRAGCPAAQTGRAQQLHRRLPQRQALHTRRIAQQFQSAFADATRRRVDGALEGRIVIAVGDQA